MVGRFVGRRVLVIGLGSFLFLIMLGSFQNFSDVGLKNYEYTVVDIGNLGGPLQQAIPASVNKLGHVAGQSQNAKGEWHAFMWSPREGMRDLGTLGGAESRALLINDQDEVFGLSLNKKGELRRFQWALGEMKDLGISEFTMNSFNSDMAVGIARTRDEKSEAAVFLKGSEKYELVTLGGHYAMARGFNSEGMIIGESENKDKTLRPTVWRPKGPKKMIAQDIFEDLKTPSLMGRGFSINAHGEVVGQAITPEGSFAFIWDEKGGVKDINRLMRESDPEFPKRKWVLQQALAIGGCGQVAGLGLDSNVGSGRAFLLTPIEVRTGCN